jgi:hypothetical protein
MLRQHHTHTHTHSLSLSLSLSLTYIYIYIYTHSHALLQIKGFDQTQLAVATLLFEGNAADVAAQQERVFAIAKAHGGLLAGEGVCLCVCVCVCVGVGVFVSTRLSTARMLLQPADHADRMCQRTAGAATR